MKIGQTTESPKPDAAVNSPDSRAAQTQKTKDEVPAQQGNRVELSDLSKEVKNIASELSKGEVFDSAKVESVKKAIANGTFKVDAEVVADKLIAATKESVGKPSV